jgi:hypothetical protein
LHQLLEALAQSGKEDISRDGGKNSWRVARRNGALTHGSDCARISLREDASKSLRRKPSFAAVPG